MRVVEIFKSIEGEGIRVGLPVTFIRLWGCNLRCSYCDTPYSHSEDEDKVTEMSVLEIVNKVVEMGCQYVTITGGEPMIHTDINKLIDSLLCNEIKLNIETNGTQPIPKRYERNSNIIFTLDYKCPCSGMNEHMKTETFDTMRHWDALKFVVGSKEDLDLMVKVVNGLQSRPQVFVSPVFGMITPKEIVEYVLEHKLYYIRVQVQLHKIIWAPEERGV